MSELAVNSPSAMSGADARAAVLESIARRNGGLITTGLVLDEARDPASPLHSYFEWDEARAAEFYLHIQAGLLIRRWKGTIVRKIEEPRRITATIRRAESTDENRAAGYGYELVEQIMDDPEKRAALLRTAMRELAGIRRRYIGLDELAGVWAAVDTIPM